MIAKKMAEVPSVPPSSSSNSKRARIAEPSYPTDSALAAMIEEGDVDKTGWKHQTCATLQKESNVTPCDMCGPGLSFEATAQAVIKTDKRLDDIHFMGKKPPLPYNL